MAWQHCFTKLLFAVNHLLTLILFVFLAVSASRIRDPLFAAYIVFWVLGVLSVVAIVLVGCEKQQPQPQEDEVKNASRVPDSESGDYLGLEFDFRKIEASTGNFSVENKLGHGGYGVVYRGKLESGQEVAVKMLSVGASQGDKEFKNEATLVAKLQHRNLVTLFGFAIHGTTRLLIYPYFKRTSLDRFIFDPVKRLEMNWDTRFKIIKGIAKGLMYLHEDSPLRIIHRDLKASNVLLDDEWNPKIADFGIARLFEFDETHAETNKVVGTLGYIAPEACCGEISSKLDVFSFGVLVLEIVSGQKTASCISGGMLSFVWSRWQEGSPQSAIDPMLRADSESLPGILKCIHIALLCAQTNPADRPTMASIVFILSNPSISLPPPSEPPFLVSSTRSMELQRSTEATELREIIISTTNSTKSSSMDLNASYETYSSRTTDGRSPPMAFPPTPHGSTV